MNIINCEACAGIGQVRFTEEPFSRDCLLCNNGKVPVTFTEILELEKQKDPIIETLEII